MESDSTAENPQGQGDRRSTVPDAPRQGAAMDDYERAALYARTFDLEVPPGLRRRASAAQAQDMMALGMIRNEADASKIGWTWEELKRTCEPNRFTNKEAGQYLAARKKAEAWFERIKTVVEDGPVPKYSCNEAGGVDRSKTFLERYNKLVLYYNFVLSCLRDLDRFQDPTPPENDPALREERAYWTVRLEQIRPLLTQYEKENETTA